MILKWAMWLIDHTTKHSSYALREKRKFCVGYLPMLPPTSYRRWVLLAMSGSAAARRQLTGCSFVRSLSTRLRRLPTRSPFPLRFQSILSITVSRTLRPRTSSKTIMINNATSSGWQSFLEVGHWTINYEHWEVEDCVDSWKIQITQRLGRM